MSIPNHRKEELLRLQDKTLDARFEEQVRRGMNCSPFEAKALVQVVREVYGPHLGEAAAPVPGQIALVAVDADEPAGKPVRDCAKVTVRLTVHRGAEDDALLRREGPTGFRRARLEDLCQQALSQGGLLTREDLAAHVFYVSTRTISRDLAALRKAHPDRLMPLRSNLHDIGPVITHRVRVVELALEGRTTTEICRILRHSPEAVNNYVGTFARCALMHREGLHPGQIAFLLRRSRGLVEKYLGLIRGVEEDPARAYHLREMLLRGQGEKKSPARSHATGGGRHG